MLCVDQPNQQRGGGGLRGRTAHSAAVRASGVVYLEHKDAAKDAPDVAAIAEATIARIQAVCRERLSSDLIGFSRNGKGLKYAPFYDLFFTPRPLAPLIGGASLSRQLSVVGAGN